MARRAFVVIAEWPFEQLTSAGQLTWCCTGGTENHLGLFIPCCTADEIKARLEVPTSEHETARGKADVAFDYMSDRLPRFQAWDNQRYYTREARVWLYPILDVDASAVHEACLEVARAAPENSFLHRCDSVFWCWPRNCWCSNTPAIAPSTCVALTLRIIARARSASRAPYLSDEAAFEELDMPRCGATNCWAPQHLTGHTPRSGLEALQRAGVVGRPVQSFQEAVASCRGGGAPAPLGNHLPLLSVLDRI